MTLWILWHQPQRASPHHNCSRQLLSLWWGSGISLFCRCGPLPFCFRMELLAPPWSVVWKLNKSRYQALALFLWLFLGDWPFLEGLLKHPSRNTHLVGIFVWFVVLTNLMCHDLAPPSVVDISELVLGMVVSPLAVLMIVTSSWRTIIPLCVSPLWEGDFAWAQDMQGGLSTLA